MGGVKTNDNGKHHIASTNVSSDGGSHHRLDMGEPEGA